MTPYEGPIRMTGELARPDPEAWQVALDWVRVERAEGGKLRLPATGLARIPPRWHRELSFLAALITCIALVAVGAAVTPVAPQSQGRSDAPLFVAVLGGIVVYILLMNWFRPVPLGERLRALIAWVVALPVGVVAAAAVYALAAYLHAHSVVCGMAALSVGFGAYSAVRGWIYKPAK